MQKMEVSPKYLMELIGQIEKIIWQEFSSYKNVRHYIEKWHEHEDHSGFNNDWENFTIYEVERNIDLTSTLHSMNRP